MAEDMVAVEAAPCRVWDKGGVRPVLALHCSLAHAGAWSGLVEHLSGVTVTALDQPGHGRAADWDGVTDLHGLTTRQSIAMAETLGGGDPVDVMGHSFGATVALRMALERPDLVRSLVLIEPPLFAAARAGGSPVFASFRRDHLGVAQALAEGHRHDAAAMFHGHWGNGAAFADLPARQQHYMIDRIHFIAAQNPFLLEDSAGLLRYLGLESIGVPVLLVEGGASLPIVGAVQDELTRRLPQATRLVVPGAGHMVPITHPGEVAQAVMAHLAGC
jgi:lipase